MSDKIICYKEIIYYRLPQIRTKIPFTGISNMRRNVKFIANKGPKFVSKFSYFEFNLTEAYMRMSVKCRCPLNCNPIRPIHLNANYFSNKAFLHGKVTPNMFSITRQMKSSVLC